MAIDLAALEKDLLKATTKAFQALKKACPKEQFYAFGLYTNEELSYVVPTANSEEALARIAEKAASKNGSSPELQAASLRWSPCDWEYHLRGEEEFTKANDFLNPYLEGEEFTGVLAVFLGVLRVLDQKGLFGTGAEREALTVNLLMGDQSDEARLQGAGVLNPEAHVTRLREEFERSFRAFKELSGS